MVEIFGFEKLFSFVPRKKFGPFCKFSTSQFGNSHFSDDDIYFFYSEFGNSAFGIDFFGNVVILSGIYRTDNVTGETLFYREPYYITRNPRTESQQANRQKFADAMTAWHDLTDEQREVYTKYAHKIKMWGRNLFIKEYLLSH